MGQSFADRESAGRALAGRLLERSWSDPVVLGLPRGGVPVAHVVAVELGAALDVVVARKIGAPGQPELALGAVTAEGPPTYDERTLRTLGLGHEELAATCEQEREEARRRVRQYLDDRDPVPLSGRDVILVDDGLATGATARAALRMLRGHEPNRLVLAVPVAAPTAADALRDEADDVVCVLEPPRFRAVGTWYRDFRQVPDSEVVELLADAARGGHEASS